MKETNRPRDYPQHDGGQIWREMSWKRTWTCKSCLYVTRRGTWFNKTPRCPRHGDTMKKMPWKFKLPKKAKR